MLRWCGLVLLLATFAQSPWWLGGCSEHAWSGSPQNGYPQCKPTPALKSDPAWSTFKKKRSVRGCLQMSWGSLPTEADTIPVRLDISGNIFGRNPSSGTFEQSPQFPSGKAPRDKRKTFRLFVFTPSALDDLKAESEKEKEHLRVCREVMGTPGYDCLSQKEKGLCWYHYTFQPPVRDTSGKVSFPGSCQISCRNCQYIEHITSETQEPEPFHEVIILEYSQPDASEPEVIILPDIPNSGEESIPPEKTIAEEKSRPEESAQEKTPEVPETPEQSGTTFKLPPGLVICGIKMSDGSTKQCPSGHTCYKGFCHKSCTVLSGCTSGEICMNSLCFKDCIGSFGYWKACPVGTHCIQRFIRVACSMNPELYDGAANGQGKLGEACEPKTKGCNGVQGLSCYKKKCTKVCDPRDPQASTKYCSGKKCQVSTLSFLQGFCQ